MVNVYGEGYRKQWDEIYSITRNAKGRNVKKLRNYGDEVGRG
jgi:hypothetical protein